MSPHFKPADGHVADVVPFFWEGVYHAFYLKRRPGRGTPYAHAASRDLVHWEELPDALETGGPGEPDHGNCFTGSIIERDGLFHLFYTGYTPDNPPLPRETVCHATSRDLITWSKDPGNPILLADERVDQRDDWRDPYVFWNEAEGRYWMLLCARDRVARTPRRGCIALATLTDLRSWEVQPPLWKPNLVFAPECPDAFQAHGRWFLLFSNHETRYRSFARWPEPWTCPPITDALDTPRFYAAKAFHAGDRHLLAGWVSSNEGETDAGRWEWGGTMGLLRELVPSPDGELWVRPPEEVRRTFSRTVLGPGERDRLRPLAGRWESAGRAIYGSAPDGMALALFPEVPDSYRLTVTMTVSGPAAAAGVLLRLPEALDGGYQMVVEPGRQRVLVRKWAAWGDTPPTVERPLAIQADRPIRIEAYVQGPILEVFFDDRVAMTTRIYDFSRGALGLFVMNGQVTLEDLEISTPG